MFTIFILQIQRVAIYYWIFKSQVLHTPKFSIYINFPFAGSSSPPLLAIHSTVRTRLSTGPILISVSASCFGAIVFQFSSSLPLYPQSRQLPRLHWIMQFMKLPLIALTSPSSLCAPPKKKSNWEYRSMIECLLNIHKALCSVPSTRHPPKKTQKICSTV